MATHQQHLKQWAHNRAFLASILFQSDSADWLATVAFYAALHAVQILLLHDRQNPTSHFDREMVLLGDVRYKPVWKDYKAFYDASHAARYDCSGWINTQRIRLLIKERMPKLETTVFNLANETVAIPDLFKRPYDAPPQSGARDALAAAELWRLSLIAPVSPPVASPPT